MGVQREDRQSHFFMWLSRSVSPAQLSELYQAFSDLEEILASHRYYHRLSRSLAETTDITAIETLYNDLSANRQFMRSYRSGVKLSLLRYYARYCRENTIESAPAESREETSSGDCLIDRLNKDGISYVDNRPKNGALWFAQASGTDALIKDFKAQGMQFNFSTSKQQWWTRDSSPSTVQKKEAVDPSTIKANQQAFIAWLKRQDYDTVEQFSIYGTARKIHTMLLSDEMAKGLFGIQDFELVRSSAIAARKENKFLRGDREERGLWTQSLDCYLQFAKEGLVSATQTPAAEKPISERVEPAIRQQEDKQTTVEQPRQEKQISVQTSEEGFRRWLTKQYPQENADSIIAVVRVAEQFAQRTHMRDNRLLGIAPSSVKANVNHLIVSRAFANSNSRGYREFKQAAPLLIEYAGSISVPGRITPTVQEHIETSASASLETKGETATDIEPALAEMLQDEQFTDLRKALSDKGIRTLDDLKRLNLWVFMNQNGLYSIGQRQTVYSAIRRALESSSSVEVQTKWKLVTSRNEYTGASPAEALMAYCRVIATRYPLRFRNLIGIRMPGTGLIPLMSSSVHEDDPCLGYPKAYINSKLDADKAKMFGRWIATSCRDTDVPLSVTCTAPASNIETEVKDNPTQTKAVEPPPTQVTEEGTTVSFDAFRTFLMEVQHLAERTAGNYWTSIRMIEEYLKRNHLGYSLVKTNADQAQQISDLLMSRRDFVQINDERHHQYSAALYQFILFLRQEGGESLSGKPNVTREKQPIEQFKPSEPTEPSLLQKRVEKLVLDADLDGLTLDRLYTQIPDVTMVALKQIRDASPNLVDMGDKLVHVEAFVDWDEAAEKLHDILEKLFTKNNGYVSNTQLWDYAKAEMHMFLNDNDISDMWSLYYIARHMFEKTNWHDVHYVFSSSGHISLAGEKALSSNLDVIRKYARENNGFFRYNDLVEYLESVGIKTGNLRGQMRIGGQPIFFYYNYEEIISAESMGIDEAWLNQVEQALKRLFADAGDHIVLRAINPIWFEQLPTLPGYRPWTRLLLQYVLMFYGKRLGAKTIGSELNQNYYQLHAMLVTQDSVVQTFADAVVAYLVDSEIDQRQFEAEELRGVLLKGGLITGNELIWHVPKAIGSDPRFAWDMSGQNVKVLWIDALGAEWLPLLKWALETSGEGSVASVQVTQALLPSETRFNELWNQMEVPYEKYDKLDKLAHKGVIDDRDYYACVEEQFHFVSDIVTKVDKLLKQYSRVLITGDHGTSRLAARFFHTREAMPLPSRAEVGSHGRFCRISGDQPAIMTTQKAAKDSNGNHYIVFSNYDHYPQSGYAAGADDDDPVYGEIHGGASPEEMLVPVFTVNSKHEMPLTAKWLMPGNSVKISNKRAKCRVQFSKPVSLVQAKIGDLDAECSTGMVPSKDWVVTFTGLKVNKPTQFTISLLADGTLIGIDPVEIKPALGGDDPF